MDVDIKTNEIPKNYGFLLDSLDIVDKVVTTDALHTQVETAPYLVEDNQAHDITEVKRNQRRLYEAIETVPLEDYSRPMVTVNQGHNRIEHRVVRTSTALNTYLDWPYVGQIFRIDRHVTDLLAEHLRDEIAFGVSDWRPTVAPSPRIGKLVRGHWRIETRWHYVRDLALDEDRSQIRTASGPQVMATFRNIAIGLIQRMLEHLGRRPDQVGALLLS